MIRAIKIVLALVGLVVGVVAVLALREATLSTHQPVARDSQIELIVTARTRHTERNQTMAEMVEAQVLTCRLEVTSDVVGEIEHQGGNRFRAILQPSMDETNRRQFRGCLEDWMIDGVWLNVVELRPLD